MLNARQSDPRFFPRRSSVRRRRTGADQLLEQLDHFSLAGNFSIQNDPGKNSPPMITRMLRIPKWRLALPLASAKDRLELFFKHRRLRRSCCAGCPRRSDLRSFAFSRLRRRTLGPSASSGKPLPRRARDRAARRAALRRDARNKPLNTKPFPDACFCRFRLETDRRSSVEKKSCLC
jgi:hypothetical protein